jgi:hypothetical protein
MPKKVIKHWVQDFKIDGFRWDQPKIQNCKIRWLFSMHIKQIVSSFKGMQIILGRWIQIIT